MSEKISIHIKEEQFIAPKEDGRLFLVLLRQMMMKNLVILDHSDLYRR